MNRKTFLPIFSIIILSLSSCDDTEPLSNYKNAIVHDKMGVDLIRLEIQKPDTNTFKLITVSEYDYSRYNIGDTIK